MFSNESGNECIIGVRKYLYWRNMELFWIHYIHVHFIHGIKFCYCGLFCLQNVRRIKVLKLVFLGKPPKAVLHIKTIIYKNNYMQEQ